jgi:hypothetical protein
VCLYTAAGAYIYIHMYIYTYIDRSVYCSGDRHGMENVFLAVFVPDKKN